MVLYGTAQLRQRGDAHTLLEIACRETWGWKTLPQMEKAEGGKPFFPGHPGREFNLSHSGRWALAALDSAPVGVDIQEIRTLRASLPKRVCSPEELEWLYQEESLWERFALLWSLKESRVKFTGEGLRQLIQGIRVPLPECLTSCSVLELDGLRFRTYAGEGWYASVCGTGAPPEVINWRNLEPVE